MSKASNDNEKPRVWTQNEAVAQLGIWRDEVAKTHRMDIEPGDLTRLVIGVINGKMDPTEAVNEAHKKMMSRQEGKDGI